VWNSHNHGLETAASTLPAKKASPFKSFFTSAIKSNGSDPGIDAIPIGSQDDQYGVPVCLNGQVGSVCIFHDTVSAAQVKKLYTVGPNNLTVFTEEADLQDLPSKMVLYYNARVGTYLWF